MIHHPAVQTRAQAELDLIIGNQRLPTLQDQLQLPYTSAVVKEILRWKPQAPVGKP